MPPRRRLDPYRLLRRLFPLVLLLSAAAARLPARAQSVLVQGRIVDVAEDDLYVDVGTGQGLQPGDIGSIGLNGAQIARVQVMEATRFSARLRILSRAGAAAFQEGDRVNFHLSHAPAQAEKLERTTAGGANPPPEEPFVPLLAPLPPKKAALPVSKNIFHGRLRARQIWQTETRGISDYNLSSVDTDGSIDRIQGTSLSLVWSGLATYRTGSAFVFSPDYKEVKLDLYRMTLSGNIGEEGSFYRMGRFLPQELPAVGFVDGAQAEWKVSDHLRVGNVAGAQPRPQDLAFWRRQTVGTAYATVEAGRQNDLFYSGTFGYLETFFHGKPDRVAFLNDQRADIGPRLNLYSTAEMDLDWTSTRPRGGTRLTRLNVYGSFTVTSFLGLRSGTDYYGHLDTRAERAYLGPAAAGHVPGYWRYWVGSHQSLGRRFRLNEDVSFLDAPNDDSPARWQVSATQIGLPLIPDAQVTLTTYNLYGGGTEGYGNLLSSFLPFFRNRLILTPSCGFRYIKEGSAPAEWDLTDYAARMDLRFNKHWGLFGGVSRTFSTVTRTLLLEAGLNYRW